jgi:hypothetical protein
MTHVTTKKNEVALTNDLTRGNESEQERKAIQDASKRLRDRPIRTQVAIERPAEGKYRTSDATGDVSKVVSVELADTFGTTSQGFVDASMSNLLTFFAAHHREVTRPEINGALAVIDGMKPENEVEAMLLSQMVATYETAMSCLAMISKCDMITQTEIFGKLATKMLRTFTAQTEALAKLRRKGEQTVKVVHVYPGGQAVVAETINQGSGAHKKAAEQSHEPNLAAAVGRALLGQDPAGNGMSVPGHARPEAVPHPQRREPRCASR